MPVHMSETSHPVCTSFVRHQSVVHLRCQSLVSLLSPTSDVGKLVGKIEQPPPPTPTQPNSTPMQPNSTLPNSTPSQPHPAFHTWLCWLGLARSIQDKRAACLFSETFDTEAGSANSQIPRDGCVGRQHSSACWWDAAGSSGAFGLPLVLLSCGAVLLSGLGTFSPPHLPFSSLMLCLRVCCGRLQTFLHSDESCKPLLIRVKMAALWEDVF